ncbi:hypothetical protein [Streptomyces sp. NPDC057280]|uniref:hypothetical protein n=1 Tax=Streptomyces sp. NPDC057280 TaxID=3346081 RepID=UPI003633B74A
MKRLPDCNLFHESTTHTRLQEQHAEAQLIALGALAPRAGCAPAVRHREALVAVGAGDGTAKRTTRRGLQGPHERGTILYRAAGCDGCR